MSFSIQEYFIFNPLPCSIHGNGLCKSTFSESVSQGVCVHGRGFEITLGMNCTHVHGVHGGRDGHTRNILYTCTQCTREGGRTY